MIQNTKIKVVFWNYMKFTYQILTLSLVASEVNTEDNKTT